jgi:sulfur carrier protein
MKLQINGAEHDIAESVSTLSRLFSYLNLSSEGYMVELNGEIILKERFASSQIKLGDTIEIMQFIGGG